MQIEFSGLWARSNTHLPRWTSVVVSLGHLHVRQVPFKQSNFTMDALGLCVGFASDDNAASQEAA